MFVNTSPDDIEGWKYSNRADRPVISLQKPIESRLECILNMKIQLFIFNRKISLAGCLFQSYDILDVCFLLLPFSNRSDLQLVTRMKESKQRWKEIQPALSEMSTANHRFDVTLKMCHSHGTDFLLVFVHFAKIRNEPSLDNHLKHPAIPKDRERLPATESELLLLRLDDRLDYLFGSVFPPQSSTNKQNWFDRFRLNRFSQTGDDDHEAIFTTGIKCFGD